MTNAILRQSGLPWHKKKKVGENKQKSLKFVRTLAESLENCGIFLWGFCEEPPHSTPFLSPKQAMQFTVTVPEEHAPVLLVSLGQESMLKHREENKLVVKSSQRGCRQEQACHTCHTCHAPPWCHHWHSVWGLSRAFSSLHYKVIRRGREELALGEKWGPSLGTHILPPHPGIFQRY